MVVYYLKLRGTLSEYEPRHIDYDTKAVTKHTSYQEKEIKK